MLGDDSFSRSQLESLSGDIRRSIYAVNEKKAGDIIGTEDIKIIRPGLGLHPRYFFNLIGLKLVKDVAYGQPLDTSYFECETLPIKSKSSDFSLEKVLPNPEMERILFNLLRKRKFNISHKNAFF